MEVSQKQQEELLGVARSVITETLAGREAVLPPRRAFMENPAEPS